MLAGILLTDRTITHTLQGTPQGGVISPLLANIFLHVVFDKWMQLYHPEKPFERYADDIVVHCKTEKQAIFMLQQINRRMNHCKLNLHAEKTRIVNLRGNAQKQYPKRFDFLGFTIRPEAFKYKDSIKAVPGIFVSQKAKNSIMQKFRDMGIHKWRGTLKLIALKINPVIRGIINYFHKFQRNDLKGIRRQLNARLLKWVEWEKDVGKKRAITYLRVIYKENPNLFEHWRLVHP
jgi:hypothetical protein